MFGEIHLFSKTIVRRYSFVPLEKNLLVRTFFLKSSLRRVRILIFLILLVRDLKYIYSTIDVKLESK